MISSDAITRKTIALLGRKAAGRSFPFLVGVCAFVVTITFSLPVELLVVIAILISPARWISIGFFAAVGSSIASVGIYLAFHHLGWNVLIEWYPDIGTSKFWTQSTAWLSQYGPFALFALMAVPLPVPKTPALAFVAIYRMPVYEIVLAIALGKLLKYTLYAYVVSRFPMLVARWYGVTIPGQTFAAGASAQSINAGRSRGWSKKIEISRWRIWRTRL